MSHPSPRRTRPNDLFDCVSPMSVTHGHVRPEGALLYRVVDYSTLSCEITVRMLDIACRPVDFAGRDKSERNVYVVPEPSVVAEDGRAFGVGAVGRGRIGIRDGGWGRMRRGRRGRCGMSCSARDGCECNCDTHCGCGQPRCGVFDGLHDFLLSIGLLAPGGVRCVLRTARPLDHSWCWPRRGPKRGNRARMGHGGSCRRAQSDECPE